MVLNLSHVLRTLEIEHVRRHYNADKIMHYVGAKWLGNPQSIYNENCIYIGYASQMVDELPKENIGIIVVNDDGRDFSGWNIDLVELEPVYDPANICLMVKEMFFNSYEISTISKSLIEKMMQTYSIPELVELISDNLKNPVFVNFHFAGRSFYFSGDPSIEGQLSILNEMRGAHPNEETMEEVQRIWSSPMPTVSEDGFCYQGKRRMHIPITDGIHSSNPLGILTVFEVNRNFSPMDESFLAFMGYILSLKAGDDGFKKEIFSREYEQKLHDLIRGTTIDEDMSWVNSLFGSRYSNYTVAITDTRAIPHFSLENIRYRLLQGLSFSTVVMRGSYLVLIANLSRQEQDLLMSLVKAIAEEYQLVFGLSEPFDNILRLRKYYTQAKRVREISALREEEVGVFSFGEHKFTLLLKDIAATENPELFVDESIDRLIAHDAAENTEYVQTLETYILSGMSNDKTRSILNIHRNTLAYRLNKIEEIVGHSLNDGAYLMNLYFASILRKSLGKYDFNEK